jgi:tRNA(fMet)-specific endonuclease VapC
MLDTDISSYIIDEQNHRLIERLSEHQKLNDPICISSVTYAEIMYGAHKRNSKKLLARIAKFMPLVHIVNFNKIAADEYAKIRIYMESRGEPRSLHDLQIAACARADGAVIVTNNTRHYDGIPDLVVENWVE